MAQLPEKPAGSSIAERHDPGGLFLIWKLPDHRPIRLLLGAFMVVWLCGWAVVGIVLVFDFLIKGGGMPWLVSIIMAIIFLPFWALGIIYAFGVVRIFLRAARPESTALGLASFRHDPGWGLHGPTGLYTFSSFLAAWNNIFKIQKPIELPKSDLKAFILDRVGERQRLAFDSGADRIEIGSVLREPERECLFRVLEAWRTG